MASQNVLFLPTSPASRPYPHLSPDAGSRQSRDLLAGDDWQDVVNTLDQSLSNEDSQQAMELVADLVASVERLRRDRNVQELVLFWTTANHVALLAAANLTTHVIPKLKFMEWDHAQSQYVHLPMPGE